MSFIRNMSDAGRKIVEGVAAAACAVAIAIGSWNLKTTHDLAVSQAALAEKVAGLNTHGSSGLSELARENSLQHQQMMSKIGALENQVGGIAVNIEWLIRDRKTSANRKGDSRPSKELAATRKPENL